MALAVWLQGTVTAGQDRLDSLLLEVPARSGEQVELLLGVDLAEAVVEGEAPARDEGDAVELELPGHRGQRQLAVGAEEDGPVGQGQGVDESLK